MVEDTILQHWIFTKFALPFLLLFFLVFAILEKTKIFGDDKKQLNALFSFVIALVFVSAVYPKLVVENLILFLTVALVVMFVGLIMWGFVSGSSLKENILSTKGVKWVVGIFVVLALIGAVIWATGMDNSVINFFFKQSWSSTFWINVLFVAVIAVALALLIRSSK
ncbi:MAG: hypothetical protein ABH804_02795 [archaeon]